MEHLPSRPTALAEFLGISVSYAHALLKGDRPWSQSLALSVYRKTGEKIGPIVGATDEEIEVLERFASPRPERVS